MCTRQEVNAFLSPNVAVTQPTPVQRFGRRIAQLRRLKAVAEERDIDQKTVADAMDVAQSTVSRWEAGDVMPKDDVLVRLAEYFHVEPGWLRYGGRDLPTATGDLDAVLDPTKDRRHSREEIAAWQRQLVREQSEQAAKASNAGRPHKKRP